MIETKLYGGEVNLIFDEKKHKYYANGKYIPGTTSITGMINKPALMYWSARMAADYFRENYVPGTTLDEVEKEEFAEKIRTAHRTFTRKAATIGTVAHKYCEDYINYELGKNKEEPKLPINANARNSAQAFLDWVKDNKVQFISSEKKIFSKKYEYCGTMDIDAIVNGKRCVVDLKTCSGIYDEMHFQTAAYQHAAQEELGIKYHSRWILRIDKETGIFEPKHLTQFKEDFKAFLACKTLFDYTTKD